MIILIIKMLFVPLQNYLITAKSFDLLPSLLLRNVLTSDWLNSWRITWTRSSHFNINWKYLQESNKKLNQLLGNLSSLVWIPSHPLSKMQEIFSLLFLKQFDPPIHVLFEWTQHQSHGIRKCLERSHLYWKITTKMKIKIAEESFAVKRTNTNDQKIN